MSKADRDTFMAVDSVEDWIEESDPFDVEQTLYGVMDHITELERAHEKRISDLRYAILIEGKTCLALAKDEEDRSISGIYRRVAARLNEILDADTD